MVLVKILLKVPLSFLDLQGVPENMRHHDFFTSYMSSYKYAIPRGINKIQEASHKLNL